MSRGGRKHGNTQLKSANCGILCTSPATSNSAACAASSSQCTLELTSLLIATEINTRCLHLFQIPSSALALSFPHIESLCFLQTHARGEHLCVSVCIVTRTVSWINKEKFFGSYISLNKNDDPSYFSCILTSSLVEFSLHLAHRRLRGMATRK